MKMKRLLGNALNSYMMVPFHLKNTMYSQMKKNSYAVWKTLRHVNHANETAYRERLGNPDFDGDTWHFHSVSGGGLVSDRPVVVLVDEDNEQNN